MGDSWVGAESAGRLLARAGRQLVWLLAGGTLAWGGCRSEPVEPISAAGGSTNPASLGGATSTDTNGATTHASGGSGGGASGESGESGNTTGSSSSSSSSSSSTSAGGSGGMAGEAGAGGEVGDAAPVPELDGLVVAGVEIGLKPKFDPETTRYSVLASEPAGELNVTAMAESGLQIQIQGQAVASGEPAALPDVVPGSNIEVQVANHDGDEKVYQISYLPADFPDFRVLARKDSASEDPLYLAARSLGASYVVKLNNDGVPLFYRKTARPSFDFKKHATGQLSYAEFRGDTTLAEHIVLDETYTEVDRVRSVGLADTDEHEFLIQPNGNYIVLAYEPVVRDLSEWGRGSAEIIRDGIWQELSPDHELLFQWNSWYYMNFGESLYLDANPRDYSHMNSLFVDEDGNWIVSSRGMSQVLKIDRIRGDIIWRLGGVQNDFTFVNDPYGGLCGQHTASILDNGHLLVFDNGQYCYPEMPERGELTRIVEYALDEDEMTAELVWSYDREGAYCQSQGSAQRLANGNTLIGWGLGTDLMVTEVTADKDIVFELQGQAASGGTQSYRAWRFAD